MKKAEDMHDNKVIGAELTDEQLMKITGGFVPLVQSERTSGVAVKAVGLSIQAVIAYGVTPRPIV